MGRGSKKVEARATRRGAAICSGKERQIAVRLRTCPFVVVKGPPGTGEGHTIGNLITHLFRRGQRIVVTAGPRGPSSFSTTNSPSRSESFVSSTWAPPGRQDSLEAFEVFVGRLDSLLGADGALLPGAGLGDPLAGSSGKWVDLSEKVEP